IIGLRQTLENGFRGMWVWRVFGTFIQPNLYASCLLFALPLALLFALRGKRLVGLGAGLAALLLLSPLFCTGSRGALYIPPVSLAIFVAMSAWGGILRARTARVRLAVLLALCVPVGLVSSPTLRSRTQLAQAAPPTQLLCAAETLG